MNFDSNPEYMCAGGGFGPVDANGYGVAYMVFNDKTTTFTVSSRVSSAKTVNMIIFHF
jgi:hypothetical protein